MSLLKFPSLLPRENKFHVLIEGLSAQAASCARHLHTFVGSTDDSARARAGQAIGESRLKTKALAADMTRELCRTFVTPFDREDIQDFASDLYKIPKTIEKVRERLTLHGLHQEKGDFLRQTDLIVQEAEAMEIMVRDLVSGQSARQIQDKIAVLYDLEHKGDAVLGELLVSLFSTPHEARDLILRKDIYDMLEKIIDRYRDAAGVALQMVLKHT